MINRYNPNGNVTIIDNNHARLDIDPMLVQINWFNIQSTIGRESVESPQAI